MNVTVRRRCLLVRRTGMDLPCTSTQASLIICVRIRQRASELYDQRGRVDGFALDDWLQAETEIVRTQKQQKVKAAKGSK